jgi:peptide/nickel transport system substrate-binding protein
MLRTHLIDEWQKIRASIQYLKNFRLSYIGKVFSLMGDWEKIALGGFGLIFIIASVLSLNNLYVNQTHLAPQNGGSYTEGVLGQPRYINPLFATSDADEALVSLVFSGLYRYDSQGQLVPDLAESLPQTSEDQKEYTVRLRENSFWHDGQPVTVDDIIFTIESIQNPEVRSPLRSSWLSTTAKKIDERTVVFQNADISGPFIQNLTTPLIQKTLWEQVAPQDFISHDNNLKAIGNGLFTIKEITQQSNGAILSLSLEANTSYVTGRPHLDNLTIRFFETYEDLVNAFYSNEIEGVGIIPLETNAVISGSRSKAQNYTIALAQYQAAFFNLNSKILADLQVRKALQAAVDKHKLINEVLGGRASISTGPFLNLKQTDDKTNSSFNLELGEKILTDAGWKRSSQTGLRSKNGVPLEFNITTNDTTNNVKIAEFLINSWQAMGINVRLVTVPSKDLSNEVIRPRNFDVLVFAQQLGRDPDPFAFWHSSQIKDPGLNVTGFTNPQADKLINQARTTTDETIRKARYDEFATLISEQVPAVFLDQSIYAYTVKKDLKGINTTVLYDPALRFSTIQNWYIKEQRDWGKN